MIKVSILYPARAGARFDFDYYLKTHMPLSLRLMGAPIKGASVERGISSAEPGSTPAYVALCHFTCESRASFEAAFLPHAQTLQGDMANYTDIVPLIQFSEIELSR